MVSVRILVEGAKVQKVGYRLFLLERALWSGIENIYVKNVGSNKVELLLRDLEEKVDSFYEIVKSEKPEGATVKSVSREPYLGKVVIPPIDRYFQFLTLEQLSTGREEFVRLPDYVGKSVGVVASAISGIDEKFGEVVKRFGVFGESARSMDGKLSGMDEKLKGMDDKLTGLGGIDDRLKGINEKLDKISTLPEKIDGLPERIAQALNSTHRKQA